MFLAVNIMLVLIQGLLSMLIYYFALLYWLLQVNARISQVDAE